MALYKTVSLFAGVGGIDIGFEENGFKTVYANEYDNYAADTYEANFPKIQVDRRDVHEVGADEIPDFDILLAGFPCQAFSIAGYRQGFDDKKGRGELFFEIVRIMEQRKPRVAFFENVKNLVSHDKGNTFRVIREQLDELGYQYSYQVMNACEYGNVPQNRERIYIVAFRDEEDFMNFHMPLSIPLTKSIHDILEQDEVDESFFYTADKYDCYNMLKEKMKKHDTIYQWRRVYVRENKSNLIPTLTANMGTGGHNVPLILTHNNRIRKLTPRECFNAQGFPLDFILTNQAKGRLYKQAGNSVVVPVISRIAKNLEEALVKTDYGKIKEERIIQLIKKMCLDNREKDILAMAEDKVFREQLFVEYSL